MGGIKSPLCNKLAKDIWDWAIQKQIWISACHIAGIHNEADYHGSRHYNENIEWMLDRDLASQIMNIWDSPTIDMIDLKDSLDRFVSWKNDAAFLDAFTMLWDNLFIFL